MPPTIAILGASANRSKYGNRAVRAYARLGYQVFPIHPREETIEGHPVYRSVLDVPAAALDKVSFYVPPTIGLLLIDDVARKPVREVWFNPGAESAELIERARQLGLNVIVACSIVAVGISPYDLD
ncbi:MAG: CoA-binding protein [Gemmataceae bacterium]